MKSTQLDFKWLLNCGKHEVLLCQMHHLPMSSIASWEETHRYKYTTITVGEEWRSFWRGSEANDDLCLKRTPSQSTLSWGASKAMFPLRKLFWNNFIKCCQMDKKGAKAWPTEPISSNSVFKPSYIQQPSLCFF